MKKGVTLIEVLVASLIAVIGISGSLLCIVKFNEISLDDQYRSEAVTICKFILEKNNGSAASTLTALSTTYPTGDSSKWDTITSNGFKTPKIFFVSYEAQRVTLQSIQPGVIQFKVQVSWKTTSGQDNKISITTRITEVS